MLCVNTTCGLVLVQFKLEVEEVDDASSELSKYRQDVCTPLIIQVR